MSPARTALLVIDMQRDFLDPGGYAAAARLDVDALRRTIPAIQHVLAAARRLGMLVVHTREGHRPDLSDCPPAKMERSRAAGAEIGSAGPLGRLLVRGEFGHDFIDELQPIPGETVIDKPGYGAFHQTDLAQILQNRGIDHLILGGVTTEVCVHSTLREAVDRGYGCVLAADACGSAYPHLHAAALQMVAVEGGVFGRVADSGTLVAELEHAQETRP
ncbi:MAG: cysteine hydrolase [Thiobacillus sp. GWE1_62_9]|nr:MAG: cysteine hydrolase [Thiobacillus sp. GWE1_62_9]HBU28961.1 cysteine hydrolase [Thiobacillus sp.]